MTLSDDAAAAGELWECSLETLTALGHGDDEEDEEARCRPISLIVKPISYFSLADYTSKTGA